MNLARRTTGSVASLELVRAYPLRAAFIWFAVHAFAAGSMALSGTPGQLSSFGTAGAVILSVATGLVLFVDARRRREIPFLRNLGVSPWLPVVLGICVVLLKELALAAAT
jgi:hypothetical protein